jgi:hypothetical protein
MWPIMRATRKPRFGFTQDRRARDLVKRNVLRGELRRGCHDDAMADALRIHHAPRERLHAAEAAAHHRGETLDTERVGDACLRVHPVFHGDHREARAVRHARGRIDAHRTGGAETRTEIVHADDEEPVGVQGFAGTDHVVPPADVLRVIRIDARDVVRCVERVTDQHGIAARSVERAVGLDHQVETGQRAAVLHEQRLGEMHFLGSDDTD